jgi:hypothetical protein
MSLSDPQKARAEAAFKRKEDQARDGAKAWAEYEAKSRAVAKNMERLRALRLTKEVAATPHPAAEPLQPSTTPKRRKPAPTRPLNPNTATPGTTVSAQTDAFPEPGKRKRVRQ